MFVFQPKAKCCPEPNQALLVRQPDKTATVQSKSGLRKLLKLSHIYFIGV